VYHNTCDCTQKQFVLNSIGQLLFWTNTTHHLMFALQRTLHLFALQPTFHLLALQPLVGLKSNQQLVCLYSNPHSNGSYVTGLYITKACYRWYWTGSLFRIVVWAFDHQVCRVCLLFLQKLFRWWSLVIISPLRKWEGGQLDKQEKKQQQ
jgi:hypothetical protein